MTDAKPAAPEKAAARDDTAIAVARRYAEALIDAAQKEGQADPALEELAEFQSLVTVEHPQESQHQPRRPPVEHIGEDAILLGRRDAVRREELGEPGELAQHVGFELVQLVERRLGLALVLGGVDQGLGVAAGNGDCGVVAGRRFFGGVGRLGVGHACWPPRPLAPAAAGSS